MALGKVKEGESLAAAMSGPGLELTGAAPVAIAAPYLLASDPPRRLAASHDPGVLSRCSAAAPRCLAHLDEQEPGTVGSSVS
jgi:hypothetical protein